MKFYVGMYRTLVRDQRTIKSGIDIVSTWYDRRNIRIHIRIYIDIKIMTMVSMGLKIRTGDS